MNSHTNVHDWRIPMGASAVLLILMVLAASSGPVVLADVPQVASGTWTARAEFGETPAGAASLALADGRLLVVGGTIGETLSDAISAYDPARGAWSSAGRLAVARRGHAVTLLKDGRVLIAGGTTADGPTFDLEIYDPSSASSAHVGDMTLPRTGLSAATLKDGRVLIVGGSDGSTTLNLCEIFDPATRLSAGIAAQLSTPRTNATATTMLDGHVVVVGGTDGQSDLASAEIFDPASGTFFSTGSLQTARSGHVAVLLPNNNQVLVAGGTTGGTALASAELFADWRNGFAPAAFQMSAPRTGAAAGGLLTHDLALVGGGGATSVEYYGYATVKTDKEDYSPGEIVTISGTGWQPGETVALKITEDADSHYDWHLTAVADAHGNIINQEFYPRQDEQFQHLGMRFYVLASGAASQALTTFTDGAVRASAGGGANRFSVSWVRYSGADCTGSIVESGSDSNVQQKNFGNAAQGGALTVRFTASALSTSPANLPFLNWAGTAGTFTVDPLDPRTICVRANLTGSTEYVAVYANTPNRAPTADAHGITASEDVAATIALTGSDPDGNALTFAIVTNPLHGTLGSIGTVTCTGTPSRCSTSVTYTPAADYSGSDSFTFKVNDGAVDSPAATVNVSVNPVNDAPSFTKGPDQTVREDSAAQSVAVWATAISAGPNESGQTLTFTTSNDNAGLFSVQPSIASNGTLTYTPAPNAFGSATVTVTLMDSGGTANGGLDTSAPQTFAIVVSPVNDAPSFTKGGDLTVLEDAGEQTVIGWASAISAGPHEAGQVLTFTATNSNNALFSAQPSIAPNGTLTYTPAPDANGAATVTVVLQDDGGTANGGADTTPPQTFTITVTAVNDAPSFARGADDVVLEDSGLRTVSGWATAISAGPGDEATQVVSFSTTNSNNALFAVQPSVAADGTLTYTPATNAFGTATVTVTLQDNGGTAHGGVDTSGPRTFSITVTAVNDAPSFTKGADQTVLEDAGAQNVLGWASAISAGPNETAQALTFTATTNNNGLFSVQPAIAPNGTLTYTPAPNANGAATVTVVLQDDGGTANGGVDTTPPQSFVIIVTAVNDAPSFTGGPDQIVAEDAGPQVVAWATEITAGPADEATQALAFSTWNNNPALFSTQPSVAVNGTLTYTSAPDAHGSATITVQLKDDAGIANGGDDSSIAQTFVITVTPINDAPRNVSVYAAPPSIDEGSDVTLTVNFEDPDAGDAHTVSVVWGDGTTGPVALPAGTFTFTAIHHYADDGPSGTASDTFGIVATVSDAEASTSAGPAAVMVKNVAPIIATFSGPTAPQPLGREVTVTATFSDVGVPDTHRCTVHWDDGTETAVAASGGTCTVPHTFLSPGVYSVTVTVTDDDTGHARRALETEYIVIFDPTGGAVTGGGWIDSPPGSSAAYPNATGKANFGFVSKYKKGSYVPEGQTEFQFKAGNLNFRSSSYDFGSLVVSGWKAQYRGIGTLNGVAGYRFVLTAYDGQRPGGDGIDRLRMKITLDGNVIYDNGTGESEDIDLADPTAISGGSIVIHR